MALRRVLVSALILSFVPVHAANLIQSKTTLTKDEGKPVTIVCSNTHECDSFLQWYQKKDGETFKRIMYVAISSGSPSAEPGFETFTAYKVDGGSFRLFIRSVNSNHSATYFCACWVKVTEGGYSYKLFGPGTKLVVSDQKPAFPTVTVYHNPKNRELLCVARNMFPDVLRMTWQKKDGSKWKAVDQKTVPTTIQEMKGTLSSLFISDKNGTEELQKYACHVEHEARSDEFKVVSTKAGGNENSKEAVSGQVTCQPKASNGSSPDTDPTKKSELLTVSLSYCMLILKSLTYFGIMSVIIYKRSSQTP